MPNIEGLRIPDLPEFAGEHRAIKRYILDCQCENYTSRKWIWNVSKSFLIIHHSKLANSRKNPEVYKWKVKGKQRKDWSKEGK